ncbi:MFS transporter [Dyella jiangningensis]|uniref:MFS transporter n=1 Tax=Dyella jiangningensis TaxID=1379159 RepID=UPI00045656D8|nr:MFS transporter [Dyella jiangningensis]AHX14698.1 MFS transporter [Dyella jiangningensis]MDG2537884.1 MFS transporter [Dyella jiangningensis]
MSDRADTGLRGSRLTLRIVQIVCFTFLAYLVIGMQLAVLPPFVHDDLGLGAVIAGLVISTQYVATLLSRGFAGRTSDTAGPKRAAWIGLLACAVSGLLMTAAALLRAWPMASLGTMLLARLALGMGESCVATGCIMWGIGRVGSEHTAKVISWNGIATYGALAVGAPLGVVLVSIGGFVMIGVSAVALMLLALLLAWRRPAVRVEAGERLPLHRVFGRVAPYGMGLALGSVGFGVIATFITLYYASQGWAGAALTLSAFGVCFVGIRLLLGWTIAHFGGYRVALASLLVEAAGLFVLATASHVGVAMLGASLCGIGFSLVFPALGVVAVERVSVSNRGAALAAYSVFIDVALGVTGPLGGWIASGGRYGPMFVVAAALSLVASVLTGVLYVGYGSRVRG